jgi:hypothetical protein
LFTTSRGVVATVTYLREEDRSKRFWWRIEAGSRHLSYRTSTSTTCVKT